MSMPSTLLLFAVLFLACWSVELAEGSKPKAKKKGGRGRNKKKKKGDGSKSKSKKGGHSKHGGDSKCSPGPLKILLTNDDGFDVANVQTLFTHLKKDGHDVVLVAPYSSSSGTSASVRNLGVPYTTTGRPFPLGEVGPTTEPSVCGTLGEGSTPLGPVATGDLENSDNVDQYYILGSPAMAVLYGLDVVAPQAFNGAPPDLVISGPNKGNNYGFLTVHSGTVGAAVTALNKGIPAVAVSARGERNDDDCDPEEMDPEVIAELTLKVLESINCGGSMSGGGVSLPHGSGLTVNIPPTVPSLPNRADDYNFKMTNVGLGNEFGFRFYEDLCDCPLYVASGLCERFSPGGPIGPGLCGNRPFDNDGKYPPDEDKRSEYNAFVRDAKTVTISAIQGTYQVEQKEKRRVEMAINGLF